MNISFGTNRHTFVRCHKYWCQNCGLMTKNIIWKGDIMAEEIEKCYIDFVEELLRNYKLIEIYIQNLEEMLDDINRGISIHSINYDNVKVSPTYKIQNLIMNEAIDIAQAKKEIEINLYVEKRLKAKLDRGINNLSHLYKEIIKLKYIDNLKWQVIANKLYYAESTLRDYGSDAIKSIAITLFGFKICNNDNLTLYNMIE